MSTEREPLPPVVDVPLDVAVEELTGFEVLGIEKHFGRKMEDLGAVSLTLGTVWAYENREKSTAWVVVENMTLRRLNSYFVEPPEDVDETEPDSALGKE